MDAFTIETFQKKVLEDYFQENAPIGVRTRRESKKMTMDGAWEWMKSKIERVVGGGDVAVTDNDWAFNEMMAYFTECEEGDKYRTKEEIERDKIQAEKDKERVEKERKDKLNRLLEEHKQRVVRWASMTKEEIKREILISKKPWLAHKTDEEIKKEEEEMKIKEEKERKKREHEELVRKMKNAQMDFGF